MRTSLVRSASFLTLWVILAGVSIADLLVGMVAAVIATGASLRLLPPGRWSLHPIALARLVLGFLGQSVSAGIDVAWRALHPRMPLRPGFVIYHPQLSTGPGRDAFCTMTSLLPGTLPCGSVGSSGLVIHCLDVGQPVAEQLGAGEAQLVRVFGGSRSNG
jgi:multicomponent Na+:H+ antiporter subunit E